MINYVLAKQQAPRIKAALSKAKKVANPEERYFAVLAACRLAVKAWEQWGAWPDAWSTWQRALDDAYYAAQRNGYWGSDCPRLEEL